jgi:hypothetical protein
MNTDIHADRMPPKKAAAEELNVKDPDMACRFP